MQIKHWQSHSWQKKRSKSNSPSSTMANITAAALGLSPKTTKYVSKQSYLSSDFEMLLACINLTISITIIQTKKTRSSLAVFIIFFSYNKVVIHKYFIKWLLWVKEGSICFTKLSKRIHAQENDQKCFPKVNTKTRFTIPEITTYITIYIKDKQMITLRKQS